MSEHTPEPWDGKEIPLTAAGLARTGLGIVFTNHPATRDEAEANARRIVACVNACADVPTDWLESALPGSVQNVRDERDTYKQQRDKLLAALELVIARFGPCQQDYIFSKRAALEKARNAIAEVKGQS